MKNTFREWDKYISKKYNIPTNREWWIVWTVFIILIFSIISCTKEMEIKSHCETIVMLSDKYLLPDTSFLRTDTIYWNGAGESKRRLCDSVLQSFKQITSSQENTFVLCGTNLLEKRRYIYLK